MGTIRKNTNNSGDIILFTKKKKVKVKQNLLVEEVDFGEWWFEQTDGSTLITFFILKITSFISFTSYYYINCLQIGN